MGKYIHITPVNEVGYGVVLRNCNAGCPWYSKSLGVHGVSVCWNTGRICHGGTAKGREKRWGLDPESDFPEWCPL